MTETERADRAELAVGTLQTALRHLIDQWRTAARYYADRAAADPLDPDSDWTEYVQTLTEHADRIEGLLPALELTP